MKLPFFKRNIRELNSSLVDVLTYQQVMAKPKRFASKREMVQAVSEKYQGTAALGNQLVQRIINLRTAFVLHNGVGLERAADNQTGDEEAYLTEFIDRNDLNESLAVELVKEAEIEGQVLVRLAWDPVAKLAKIKYLSWQQTDYQVIPDPDDFTQIRSITWESDDGERVNVDPAEAVFIKFNTRLNAYDGYPAVGSVLLECEEVDQALRDWRTINSLFAKPTPYFQVPDERSAALIQERIAASGWKLGSAFASSAQFTMVGPSLAPAEMLSEEIVTKVKVIAGATGVGVHHLGFADVMTNRSTADSLEGPVELASRGDQSRWRRFYEELFAKAIRLRNRHLNEPLSETAIKPKLVGATQSQRDAIAQVWLPLFTAGAIDADTLRTKLPTA